MRFPQKATEDTWPGRDLFLKAAAVLLPSFLTWSLTLPVLQARTTLGMPTFPPTQARSLLSSNSCLLISKPSAPFPTALPASGYPPSCRPLITSALLQDPLSPARRSLPPRRLCPGFRTFAASPLAPYFPGSPSPFAGPGYNHPLPHTSCGLARRSPPPQLSRSRATSERTHPLGPPRGAPTSGSRTFFMMPVFLLLKVV